MNGPEQTPKDPKFIASAILIALIAVAGIILAGVYAFNGDDDKTPPSVTATPKQDTSSSSCGLPDGDQTIPTSGPQTEWTLAGKFAAPESQRFGPAKTKNRIHSCFARNPTGALFAAANYLADTENDQVDSVALVEARIFDDENADLARKEARQADNNGTNPATQIAAFRIEDFTPERTSVVTVVRITEGPDAGKFAAITLTLGWQDGDWRLVVPASGLPPTTALTSIAGYIPWSGA